MLFPVEEPALSYDDGSVTLFLNTKGTQTDETDGLKELLNYMENTRPEMAKNSGLREIQAMVEAVKNDREVRKAAVKYNEILIRERKEGREEGRKEGREEGLQEGLTGGILGAIKLLRDLGIDDAGIVDRVVNTFRMTKPEAEKLVYEESTSHDGGN